MTINPESNDVEKAQLRDPYGSNAFADDDILLRQALDSIGSSAYGIIAISIWVMNEGSVCLFQPTNGFWIDPIFRRENPSVALEMLLDDQRIDYTPPRPLVPGEGLEGLLYSECIGINRNENKLHVKRISVQRIIHQDFAPVDAAFNLNPSGGLVFRSLRPILEDEDQPYNRRLSLMVQAEIGKALGLPFHHQSVQGIVVFMARQSARDEDLLRPVHARHLLASTQFVSGLLMFLSHRRKVQFQIKGHLHDIYKRIHKKVMAIHNVKQFPSSLNNTVSQKAVSIRKDTTDIWMTTFYPGKSIENLLDKIKIWARKCFGGNVPLPPAKSWASLRFTFCAAFIHLFVLYWVDDYVVGQSHGRFSLQRGTIGSNVSSFFLLTASPASQPCPLIIGQIICVSISLILKYLRVLPRFLRVTFGGALSTTALARLGLTTPSATALAITFAYDNVMTSKDDWISLSILCCQTVLSVLLATILNNMSNKRQYPTNWLFFRR